MKENQKSVCYHDWKSMETACLDVSLYNRYQEGLYLAGAYYWINTRFKKCLINLGDTLYRHNLRHQYSTMHQAHKKSYELGDQWLENNQQYLSLLTIPYQLIRSDDWLEDPDMFSTHKALWSFYHQDCEFQEIIQKDIQTFVDRQHNIPEDIVRQNSLSYLIEETAADILLGKRGGVAHVYPGKRHECYYYLINQAQNGTLPDVLKGLENSAFKRLSPAKTFLKPETFSHLKNDHNKKSSAA